MTASSDRPRTPPAERFKESTPVFDLHAESAALRAEPAPPHHGHRQKTLFKDAGRTVALFVMNAGGSLPGHSAAGVVTVQVIEGEVDMRVGDQGQSDEHRLKPGQILAMRPGIRHDVRAAVAPVAFLVQVSLTSSAT